MSAPPANDASAEAVGVGLLVGERYRVVERLGQGAMGAVWRAEHTSLGSAVAIKFLHQAIASERDARARFVREAKIAARLGELSRHVTRVTDHGVLAGGTPYLVMELLRGEGLDEHLKRQARLPIELVVTIATQLCRALQVAHDSGVVHRDLKPANVFLCVDEDDAPLVKLLDFGVAKALLENEAFMTSRRGAVIGSPNYMSPEQMLGAADVDARADLWAVGLVVYRMAVGVAAFGRGNLSEMADRVLATEPPPPSHLAPDLPASLDVWMRRALAKRRDDRFPDARSMALSLADALAIDPPTIRDPAPPRALAPPSERLPSSETLRRDAGIPSSRSATKTMVVVALSLLAVAIVVALLLRR